MHDEAVKVAACMSGAGRKTRTKETRPKPQW
ncbi:MAG: hypothetical protein ACI85H_000068 [Paracoccaceae bacterium]|jgi:hypothetical protein